MKKFFILLLLFSAFVSNAQNTLDLLSLTSGTPASVAYSLRKLSSSYAGPLVRIKVGTSFYDVYPDLSTKKFSLSSKISASISTYNAAVSAAGTNALRSIITAGSTNATVAIWYDQSGYGIHVYSSSAGASIITAGNINTINGQPTIKFSGSNSFLSSVTTVNYSAQTGATVNAIAQNIATNAAVGGIIGTCPGPSNQPGYNISYTASRGYQSDGDGNGYGSNIITTDPKLITSIFINKTDNLSKIYVNSVLKTNTQVLTGVVNLYNLSGSLVHIGAARGYSGFNFDGNISEAFIFPNQISASEQTLLETNQNTFYFSPLVSVSASATNEASCSGASVTFTATTYNFTATPTYQWYKNSVAISGATSSTYATTTLSHNDVIQVNCTNGSMPSIVSDVSLSLWLDAASYTSGNTWSDLSSKGKHATLTADQSYSSEGGGSFQFNGGQNAVSIPLVSGNTTDVSMQTWVYLDVTTKGPFFKNGYNNGYVFGTGAGGSGFEVGNKAIMLFSGTRWIPTNTSYGYGWKLVTMVINSSGVPSMYINNTLVSETFTGSNAATPTTGTYLGRNVGDDNATWPKFNGKMAAVYFYTKALTASEITQNYNALASRFGLASTSSIVSNSITWTISAAPSLSISVTGDGCANKSSLSATTGLSSYAWYKDNVVISGATTSSYTYPVAGDYKVTASNGTCTGTSAVTTISICGVTADGKMSPSLTSTKLVSIDGAVNSGKGVDERGLILTLPWAFSTVTTSTGKTWIDRNLGASRVATSSTDALGYGDYYQWGRPADGHQTKYYTNNNSTGFTNTRSTTSVPTTDKWIAPSDGSNDWLSTSDNTLWTGLNPVNNPCPSGYRIPTEAEWEAERITWSSNNAAGGYLSPLKLTVPGMITGFESNGATYTAKNLFGQYLTQSAYSDGGARYFGVEQNNAWFGQNYYKSHGMSVRCISK